MITQITGTDLKGITFTQDISQRTLFLGPNGSGKSARTQAFILALLGYIPGGGKKPASILENYGSTDKLIVGVKVEGRLFERGFVRKGETVSQGFKVGGKAAKEADFSKALGMAGGPVAIDITSFMDLSDQKKIDAIFDLYPPESDINQLVTDIEASKAKINTMSARLREKEGAAAQLTTARASMELPLGTLADITAQIEDTESKLSEARAELSKLQIEAAKKKAAEDEKLRLEKEAADKKNKDADDARRAELKRQAEQIIKPTSQEQAETLEKESTKDIPCDTIRPDRSDKQFFSEMSPLGQRATAAVRTDFEASIQSILSALDGAGCSTCAARLVAIRELRKYQKEAAA